MQKETTEWNAPNDGNAPSGFMYSVQDDGVRCVTYFIGDNIDPEVDCISGDTLIHSDCPICDGFDWPYCKNVPLHIEVIQTDFSSTTTTDEDED